MTSVFPKHIEQVLDSYTVPAMSSDFTDRLVAKAMAQSGANIQQSPPARWKREGMRSSPWRRGGFIASGIVGFSLVSAAAAAALSWAEIPVKIPIVSDWVESVMPATVANSKIREVAKVTPQRDVEPVGENVGELTEVADFSNEKWRNLDLDKKREIIRQRVAQNEGRIQDRRAERGLAPLTERQLQRRRMAIKRRLSNPETRRPLVRRALRQKARERAAERKLETGQGGLSKNSLPAAPAHRADNISKDTGALPLAGSDGVLDSPSSDADSDDPNISAASGGSATTSSVEADSLVAAAPTPLERLREKAPESVKQRLQNATPAQRRKILRELKTRRSKAGKRRIPRKRLRDIRRRRN